jgi:hypothetical protein
MPDPAPSRRRRGGWELVMDTPKDRLAAMRDHAHTGIVNLSERGAEETRFF